MAVRVLEKKIVKKDDSLYGLLAPYKVYATYFRILISEKDEKLLLQITDNPKNWLSSNNNEENKNYRILRRVELGSKKLFLKYLSPQHLLTIIGFSLGMNLPKNQIIIDDKLEEEGIYSLETSIANLTKVSQGINKILNLNPKRKYKIIEEFLAREQSL